MANLLFLLVLSVFASRFKVDTNAPIQLDQPGVFLRQNFDNETTGKIPGNWTVMNPLYGNFTVDDTVYHGKHGKSAKIVDNSTEGSPNPYRYFPEQRGTIVVNFAIRLANKTNLKISIDDGIGNGSNIVFWEDGDIGYRDHKGQFVTLRYSYVPHRWYMIKIIMIIPHNVYNIHIDDHLEAINVNFTGKCNQVHRMIIETRDSLLATGYIDDIEVRKCIRVPEDFPTIQEAINAASLGDTVFVAKNRVYFENVKITKSLWLVGEDKSTTIIDGRFVKTPDRSSNGILVQCHDVTIYGFTIRNSEANGIYIDHVEDSSITISNTIINNSLGSGIRVVGSKITLLNNTILLNLNHGIYAYGSNMIVRNHLIESNDECGIYIAAGENNIVGMSKIKNNGFGLVCEMGTKNNTIFQNRFVCNPIQALDYGLNKWDDGYPYKPKEEKGGGNYWSDFNAIDTYSGVNQDEHGPCCSPLPDGICDTPYIIKSKSQDNYPLFLIQKVMQSPKPVDVTYAAGVTVTATILKNVDVEATNARIYAYVDFSKLEQYPMVRVGTSDNWTGTIPAKNYCTKVFYNVSVRAFCATWLNSTNYPTDYPLPERYYHVGDKLEPVIEKVNWTRPLNENETIFVYAIVHDRDNKASGVDKVFLSYYCRESNRWWKTEMTLTKVISGTPTKYNYTAYMPKQPPGSLNFTIEAFDKAGNKAPKPSKNYTDIINELAELILQHKVGNTYENCDDPCNIDFKIMSKEQSMTNKDYRIYNGGQKDLAWKIVEIKPNPWFDIKPTSGKTSPDKWTDLTLTVNTTGCPETGIYVGEFSITANGSKPEWTIIMRVTVRHILVDDSWASCEDPARCDVNSVQNYTFHASWDHNCTDVSPGKIKISNVGWKDANKTGWIKFDYTLPNPSDRKFIVEAVNFTYVHEGKVYYITSFTQKAPNRTTIWDRVNVVLSISDNRIDVCSKANVSWQASVYEYDGSAFECYPLFNDTLHHDTIGRWFITTSSIVDTKYHLKAFGSNTVYCIWDRIKIIGGGVSRPYTSVKQIETVWFVAVYEYDNELVKGPMGILFVNVFESNNVIITNDPSDWSGEKDRWERNYSFNTPCTRTFKISAVDDKLYGLTEIKDSIEPLIISWGGMPETEEYIQDRNTALILILISVIFIVAIIAVLILNTSTPKKKNSKTKNKKQIA